MKKDYLVSKSNKLISSRYDLSLQEQRIILTLVSLINPTEHTEFFKYDLKISEFCELIGVENTNHTYIAKITKQLMTRVIEIEDNEELLQVHWISSCKYHKQQGYVEIELHKELAPYLLHLKKQFTSYYLSNVLQMKSKYSIRMYELFKSNQFKRVCSFNVDELRSILKCESYSVYANFKNRVIEQALKEINSQTDVFATYTEIKQGRKIVALEFKIESSSKLESELYWSEEKQDIFGEKYRQGLLL